MSEDLPMPFPLMTLPHPPGLRGRLAATLCYTWEYAASPEFARSPNLSGYFKRFKEWAMRILMLELAFLVVSNSWDFLLENSTSTFFLKVQHLPSICFPLWHPLFLLKGNKCNGLMVKSRRGILSPLWKKTFKIWALGLSSWNTKSIWKFCSLFPSSPKSIHSIVFLNFECWKHFSSLHNLNAFHPTPTLQEILPNESVSTEMQKRKAHSHWEPLHTNPAHAPKGTISLPSSPGSVRRRRYSFLGVLSVQTPQLGFWVEGIKGNLWQNMNLGLGLLICKVTLMPP